MKNNSEVIEPVRYQSDPQNFSEFLTNVTEFFFFSNPVAYSQSSKMQVFTKIANGFKLLTNFRKTSLDDWRGTEFMFEMILQYLKIFFECIWKELVTVFKIY